MHVSEKLQQPIRKQIMSRDYDVDLVNYSGLSSLK